jgi:oxygen-independent coproporphyrinogen-3 oxidase
MTISHPILPPATWKHSVDKQLINKYDVAGPRYTSYPTAPNFSEAFDQAPYLGSAKEAMGSEAPLSLYIHIPFCKNICYYCACNKVVTKDQDVSQRYLEALKKEISLLSGYWGNTRPVSQLHFGGGTPTFLLDAEFSELIYTLARNFNLNHDSAKEYSVEIDPRTMDKKSLRAIKGPRDQPPKYGRTRFRRGCSGSH